MVSKQGKKTLNIHLPANLHDSLKIIAVENGMTATGVIVACLEHLRVMRKNNKRSMNGKMLSTLRMDARKSRELLSDDDVEQEQVDD